jgi:hypothetical protein
LSSGFINELQASINLILFFVLFPIFHLAKSLLDSKVVRREPDLRQTAMVSLASFFRVACTDRLSAETRFPSQYLNRTWDAGRRDTWPRRFVKRIAVEISRGEAGDRSAALSALNILGHPSLIPVVIPLIEGKVRTYQKKKKTNTHTHTHTKEHAHLGDFLPYRLVILFFKVTTTEFDLISFFPVCVPPPVTW